MELLMREEGKEVLKSDANVLQGNDTADKVDNTRRIGERTDDEDDDDGENDGKDDHSASLGGAELELRHDETPRLNLTDLHAPISRPRSGLRGQSESTEVSSAVPKSLEMRLSSPSYPNGRSNESVSSDFSQRQDPLPYEVVQKAPTREEWITCLLATFRGTPTPAATRSVPENSTNRSAGRMPTGRKAFTGVTSGKRQTPTSRPVGSPARKPNRLVSKSVSTHGESSHSAAPPTIQPTALVNAALNPIALPHSPSSTTHITDDNIDPALLSFGHVPIPDTALAYATSGQNGHQATRAGQLGHDSEGVPMDLEARRLWWLRGGHDPRPAHFSFDQNGNRVDADGRLVDENGLLVPVHGHHRDNPMLSRELSPESESSNDGNTPMETLLLPLDATNWPTKSRGKRRVIAIEDAHPTAQSTSLQNGRGDDQESLEDYRAEQEQAWSWPRQLNQIVFDATSDAANGAAQLNIQQTIDLYAKRVADKWATTGVPELSKRPFTWDGEPAPLKPLPSDDRRSLGARLDSLEDKILELLQKRRKHGEEEVAYLRRVEELLLAEEDLSEDRLQTILLNPDAEPFSSLVADRCQPENDAEANRLDGQDRNGPAGTASYAFSQRGDDNVTGTGLSSYASSQTSGESGAPGETPEEGHQSVAEDDSSEAQFNYDFLFFTLLSDCIGNVELQDSVVNAFRGMAPSSAFDFSKPSDQELYLQAPCDYLPQEECQILTAMVEESINKVLGTLLAARVKGPRKARQGKPSRGWGSVFAAAALVLPKDIVLAAQESHKQQFGSYPSGRAHPDEVADRLALSEQLNAPNPLRPRGVQLTDQLYDVFSGSGSESEDAVEGEIIVVSDTDGPVANEIAIADEQVSGQSFAAGSRSSIVDNRKLSTEQRASNHASAKAAKTKSRAQRLARAKVKHEQTRLRGLEVWRQFQAQQDVKARAAVLEAATRAARGAAFVEEARRTVPSSNAKESGQESVSDATEAGHRPAVSPAAAAVPLKPLRPTWKTASSPSSARRILPRPPSPQPYTDSQLPPLLKADQAVAGPSRPRDPLLRNANGEALKIENLAARAAILGLPIPTPPQRTGPVRAPKKRGRPSNAERAARLAAIQQDERRRSVVESPLRHGRVRLSEPTRADVIAAVTGMRPAYQNGSNTSVRHSSPEVDELMSSPAPVQIERKPWPKPSPLKAVVTTDGTTASAPKRQGRPPKNKSAALASQPASQQLSAGAEVPPTTSQQLAPPKRRGRPPKRSLPADMSTEHSAPARGRPRRSEPTTSSASVSPRPRTRSQSRVS